jgi:hypothetical protein
MPNGATVKKLLVVTLIAALAGCSFTEVPPPPSSIAVNQCETNEDCNGARCNAGMCDASRTSIETLFVEVTPPTTDPQMGGIPFYARAEGFPANLAIGPIVTVTPTIRTTTTDPNCRFQGPSPENAILLPSEGTIPASITFVPSEREALSIGAPTYATWTGSLSLKREYQSTASLPPGDYDIYIEPHLAEDEENEACEIPPLLIRRQNISASTALAIALPSPTTLDLVVRGPAFDQSLTGWNVEVLDSVSGQPLSVRQTLPAPTGDTSSDYTRRIHFVPAQSVVENALAIDDDLLGLEVIRVSPPEGLLAPEFLFQLSALDVSPELDPSEPPVLIADLSPPGGNALVGSAIPPNALIEGQVSVVGSGEAVQAAVTLSANRIEGASSRASFVTTVQVDENGMFQASVPPGEYRVRAAPPPFLGLAVAEDTWQVKAIPELQAGKTIEVPPAPVISGEAILSGVGGPAFGATAMAVASPLSVGTSVFERAGLQKTDPILPRPSSDLVERNGRFDIVADPARDDPNARSTYDFFVKPEARSNYSWLVKPWILVPNDNLDLERVRLPLPFVYRGRVVVGGTTSRVPGALIRVYAYLTVSKTAEAEGCKPPSPQCAPYASVAAGAVTVVPVAETRADENGDFALLIPASLDGG